jgi:peptide/nickel transport system substrate-binding protein
MDMRRRLLYLMLVMVVLVGGVVPVGAAKRVHYGGLLSLASKYDLRSIDPAAAENPAELMMVSLLFDGLVSYNRRGELHPAIASFWVANDNHTVWDFYLQQGLKFHDGTRLTAEDVKASLERLIKSERRHEGKFLARAIQGAEEFARGERKGISGIVVRSSHKLSILTSAPQPDLLEWLALPACSIGKVVAADGDDPPAKAQSRILGTGPFAFSQGDKNKIVLTAFDAHMHGRPYLDRIEMSVKMVSKQQLILFRLGKLDLIELNFTEKAAVEKENIGVLINSPQYSTIVLGLNKQSPVFNNPRAREAVAKSIEQEGLLKILLKGEGRLASGYLPPDVAEFAGLRERPRYQPDLARALFQQSGQRAPEGLLSFITRSNEEYSSLIAPRIAVNLRDLGLRAQVESLADEMFERRLQEQKFDLFLDKLPMGSMDARLELFSVLARYAGSLTSERLEKALTLWTSAETALPSNERAKLLYRVEKQLLDDYTLQPLFYVSPAFLASPKIAGLWVDILGRVHIEDAWRK